MVITEKASLTRSASFDGYGSALVTTNSQVYPWSGCRRLHSGRFGGQMGGPVQREERTVGIPDLRDPVTARHDRRTVQQRATALLELTERQIGRAHV